MSGFDRRRAPLTLARHDKPTAGATTVPGAARWLRAWWPALLWAALIFTASTDDFSAQDTGHLLEPLLRWIYPAITQGQLEGIHFLLRKCAHVVEYAVFYLLVYRGVSRLRLRWRWSWGLAAWLIVAAYSVLDEFHQSFVPSRTASAWDSLLDSSGALVALLGVFLWLRSRSLHAPP